MTIHASAHFKATPFASDYSGPDYCGICADDWPCEAVRDERPWSDEDLDWDAWNTRTDEEPPPSDDETEVEYT